MEKQAWKKLEGRAARGGTPRGMPGQAYVEMGKDRSTDRNVQ